MCECCSLVVRNTMTAYTREVTAIREKFVGLKTLGIEVQGQEHGSFFIGIQRILNITESIPSVKRGREVVQ